MTLTEQFPKTHYMYGVAAVSPADQQRLNFLNRLAGLIPEDVREHIPSDKLHKAVDGVQNIDHRETGLSADVKTAFDTLLANVKGQLYELQKGVPGQKIATLDTVLNGFNAFNKVLLSAVTPLVLTCEGATFFKDVFRTQLISMQMAGGMVSTYPKDPSMQKTL